MKVKGRENAQWGFQQPSEGWHMVQFEEGIDYLKDSDGKVVQDKNGKNLLALPAVIKDDEDADKKINVIVSEGTDMGEQRIADVLAAIKMYATFEQNFPGDISLFDPRVMAKVKEHIPGKFAKFRIEVTTRKDKKTNEEKTYANIAEIAPADYVPPVKGAAKSASAGTAAAPAGGTKSSW